MIEVGDGITFPTVGHGGLAPAIRNSGASIRSEQPPRGGNKHLAHVGTAFYAPCIAGKWPVRGPTRTAALELGRDNMRVIQPPRRRLHSVDQPPHRRRPAAHRRLPLARSLRYPRLADPSDITRRLLFITSQDAFFATGSEFVLDVGMLLGPVPQPEFEIAA